jgi:hypothetical protein
MKVVPVFRLIVTSHLLPLPQINAVEPVPTNPPLATPIGQRYELLSLHSMYFMTICHVYGNKGEFRERRPNVNFDLHSIQCEILH